MGASKSRNAPFTPPSPIAICAVRRGASTAPRATASTSRSITCCPRTSSPTPSSAASTSASTPRSASSSPAARSPARWEGALHGLPAIAFSQDLTAEIYDLIKASGDKPDPELHAILKISAQHAARMAPELAAATTPRTFIVHNVNFRCPAGPRPRSAARCPRRWWCRNYFLPRPTTARTGSSGTSARNLSPAGLVTDRTALRAGLISHTILDYTKLGQ